MKRPWQIWLVFGLWLAVMLGVMTWATRELVRLDRAEGQARRQALLEERVRLGLWRMESTLAPLVAQESGRPYFVYTPFYPAARAYTHMFAEIERGEVRLPSPLLALESPFVRLYFQLEPDGSLTSPQVPTGNMRDLAEAKGGYTTPERIEQAAALLAELRAALATPQDLAAALPPEEPSALSPVLVPPLAMANNDLLSPAEQQALNITEYGARALRYRQMAAQDTIANRAALLPSGVQEGMMRALWLGDRLLLARRVAVNGSRYVQGVWLNWPALRARLLMEVRDLLPEAALEPLGSADADESRRLAALPLRLVPGILPEPPADGWSPLLIALVVAWGCVLLAIAAAAVLLVGSVLLAERRAAFVSAVTHETRTPLTTFRMYTEMLAEGMVTDEEKQRRYLRTLRVEAERLSHLVENVLAYARLERGSAKRRVETVRVSELIGAATQRLRGRAEQAGMALDVDVPEPVGTSGVEADVSAVEQILFNLVDNACKYAASAEEKRIHLEAASAGAGVEIRVRDHGRGISPREARRLFRPFSKSARAAAHSAPGVGLGLALSRRLARTMGGDLKLDPGCRTGACFILTLPAA